MSALIIRRNHDDNARDAPDNDTKHLNDRSGNSPYLRNLLIALLVLVVFSMILGACLYAIRRIRRARKEEASTLPSYDAATRSHNRTRLTIFTGRRHNSGCAYSEKENLIGNSSPMPLSPDSIPEIRITFPEEEDQNGRRVSGRVVVVKVGEAGVGFVRPIDHDGLPPYQQQRPTERFDSIDMDRLGGLKELK